MYTKEEKKSKGQIQMLAPTVVAFVIFILVAGIGLLILDQFRVGLDNDTSAAALAIMNGTEGISVFPENSVTIAYVVVGAIMLGLISAFFVARRQGGRGR